MRVRRNAIVIGVLAGALLAPATSVAAPTPFCGDVLGVWDFDADGSDEILTAEPCSAWETDRRLTVREGASGEVRWYRNLQPGAALRARVAELDGEAGLEIIVLGSPWQEPVWTLALTVLDGGSGTVRWTKPIAGAGLSVGNLFAGVGVGGAVFDVSVLPDADGDGGADLLGRVGASAGAGARVPFPPPGGLGTGAGGGAVGWVTFRGATGDPLGASALGPWWSVLTSQFDPWVIGLPDLSGDDRGDIVSGTFASDGGLLTSSSAAGRPLWVHALPGSEHAELIPAQLDGEGGSDLFVTASGGREALRGADGSVLWTPPIPGSVIGVAGDLGADGDDDLLWADGKSVSALDGRTGAALWMTALLQEGFVASAADLTGDGVRDALVRLWWNGGTHVISGSTGALVWSSTADLTSWGGDANGDGIEDVIAAVDGSKGAQPITVVNGPDGSVIWSHVVDVAQSHQYWMRPPLSADVDGDGRDEVVVVETDLTLQVVGASGVMWSSA